MEAKSLASSVVLTILMGLASCLVAAAASAQKTPSEGDMFPDLKLSLPQKMEERHYLKIDRGPFLLSEVDAEVLIVQIFCVYCPACRKQAPDLDSLFRAISTNPATSSRIKVIAIGAGNSSFEVNAFREILKVKFPLIPDRDFAIRKALGEVRTPYFFVLAKKPGGRQVVFSKQGAIEDPKTFLEMVCTKTGIVKEK